MLIKKRINKRNAILCLIYGLLVVAGGQYFVYYQYKDLNFKKNKFISDKLYAEQIIEIDSMPFTPGRGTYNRIRLSNDKIYPLLLENYDNANEIVVNSIISKKANDNTFEIITGSSINKYKIETSLGMGSKNFVFIGTMMFAIITFINYGFRDNK